MASILGVFAFCGGLATRLFELVKITYELEIVNDVGDVEAQ